MNGLQYIIDRAGAIRVARPRTIAQMVTRSGRIRTAERTALVPYQLTVTPPQYSRYEDVRDVIEGITMTDRSNPVWLRLSNSSGMNYITDYQGDLNTTQTNALIVSSTGTTSTVFGSSTFDTSAVFGITTSTNFDYVRLGGIPNIGATDRNGAAISTSSYIFRSGDYIQLRTLSNTTESWDIPMTVALDVQRGSGTTVDVPVHRRWVNISTQGDRRGGDIFVGNEVRLRVLIANMPAYRLLPGKLVQWDGDFELVETIT